ncbi:MAG: LptF/LptG family permease [Bacteroidetes bacterium]|nr:LptF/LptG family permease [Rhodothermia bacterium]MCX7907744.1 LptF/LptG family permease [Bacteroidota bacterium]MDW8286276.1 LptF/LptG family permease [Bacteroidota bacterium]
MTHLERMLLRAHLGPFLFAFSLLLFLLVLQFLARYLPELVGKDLGLGTILELLAYNLAYMVVLAVPMAVLVATLVAYGDLAEFNELSAARAAGIPLLRLMRPALIAGLMLAAFLAFFASEILPRANARARALWIDIRQTKPAFALRPGTFYTGLEGYSLYVNRMGADGRLYGLLIYDYSQGFNRLTIITAQEGRLGMRPDGRTLRLELERGAIDRQVGLPSGTDHQYERIRFARLVLHFDLSEYRFVRSDARSQRGTDRTMRLRELRAAIDTLRKEIAHDQDRLRAESRLFRRDSLLRAWDELTSPPAPGDSLLYRRLLARLHAGSPGTPAPLRALAEAPADSALIWTQRAAARARMLRNQADNAASLRAWRQNRIAQYAVEVHKKLAVATACVLFVLLGAPLGATVRKGGIGTAATISTLCFLLYWVLLIQGEKMADRGQITPWLGMWGGNILFGALGLWLTYRATFEVVHVDVGHWWPFRRLRAWRQTQPA